MYSPGKCSKKNHRDFDRSDLFLFELFVYMVASSLVACINYVRSHAASGHDQKEPSRPNRSRVRLMCDCPAVSLFAKTNCDVCKCQTSENEPVRLLIMCITAIDLMTF